MAIRFFFTYVIFCVYLLIFNYTTATVTYFIYILSIFYLCFSDNKHQVEPLLRFAQFALKKVTMVLCKLTRLMRQIVTYNDGPPSLKELKYFLWP